MQMKNYILYHGRTLADISGAQAFRPQKLRAININNMWSRGEILPSCCILKQNFKFKVY
jgi:hypothetical protein